MAWSRHARSTLARRCAAGLLLSCASSCSLDGGLDSGDLDEAGDVGTGEVESSGGSGSEAGTTGSSTATEGTDTSDSGEPCLPAVFTKMFECPAIIGEGFCSEGGGHVSTRTQIEWDHNPPHSGPHFPIWETTGEHPTPVERGYWVHNLEHGWIVLLHNCPDGCDPELDLLRAVIEARPDIPILMTADPLLDGPRFAAVAWTWVSEFDQPVLEDLLCFVDQHADHAPESVP